MREQERGGMLERRRIQVRDGGSGFGTGVWALQHHVQRLSGHPGQHGESTAAQITCLECDTGRGARRSGVACASRGVNEARSVRFDQRVV